MKILRQLLLVMAVVKECAQVLSALAFLTMSVIVGLHIAHVQWDWPVPDIWLWLAPMLQPPSSSVPSQMPVAMPMLPTPTTPH